MKLLRKAFVCLLLALLLAPLGFWCRGSSQPPVLVRAWGRLNSLVGESGSRQIVLGKAGWLYYRPALASSLGEGLMDDRELEALAQALAQLHKQLAQQGTGFALLIAPDKAQVYPEHLPYYIQPVAPEQSNARRLLARLKQLNIPAPDLQPLLAQSALPAYHARDSHWTAYGAYVALQAGLDAINIPGLPEYQAADFLVSQDVPMDLPPLYLPGRQELASDLFVDAVKNYQAVKPIRSLDDFDIATKGPQQGPRLLVARDSFGRAAFPYLANLAASLRFVRSYQGLDALSAGQDAVLIITAQRDLPRLLEKLRPDSSPSLD